MRAVFADTCYWIAIIHSGDAWFHEARRVTDEFRGVPIVTTADVLDEFLAYFAKGRLRGRAADTTERIISEAGFHVVEQSPELFQAGLDLYRARPDKGYSLTDCISMHVMRSYGIRLVFTSDRHFRQEGFRTLLSDSRPI